MIALTTQIHVANLKGREITDFFAHCNDEDYERWWPGTHLHLHTVDGKPAQIGSLVFMDEFVGTRRVHMTGEITEFEPGKKLVWHSKWLLRLPVKLILQFEDDESGVRITHRIEAGYTGIGRLLDPLFRLWFSPRFAASMDEHVRIEFPRLRDLIRSGSIGHTAA